MGSLSSSLLLLALCVCCIQICTASDDDDFRFSKGPVPRRFRRGQRYPDRSEEYECQPIRLHILPNTRRFRELVRYTASNVRFSAQDSRLMSSRLHSRLNRLANLFYARYSWRFTVLKSWTQYPDASLSNESLHYEGEHAIAACTHERVRSHEQSNVHVAHNLHQGYLIIINASHCSCVWCMTLFWCCIT